MLVLTYVMAENEEQAQVQVEAYFSDAYECHVMFMWDDVDIGKNLYIVSFRLPTR